MLGCQDPRLCPQRREQARVGVSLVWGTFTPQAQVWSDCPAVRFLFARFSLIKDEGGLELLALLP